MEAGAAAFFQPRRSKGPPTGRRDGCPGRPRTLVAPALARDKTLTGRATPAAGSADLVSITGWEKRAGRGREKPRFVCESSSFAALSSPRVVFYVAASPPPLQKKMAPRTRSSPARPAGDLRSRAGEPSVVAASEALVSVRRGGRLVCAAVAPRFPRGKSGPCHDLAVDVGGGARRRPILPTRRVVPDVTMCSAPPPSAPPPPLVAGGNTCGMVVLPIGDGGVAGEGSTAAPAAAHRLNPTPILLPSPQKPPSFTHTRTRLPPPHKHRPTPPPRPAASTPSSPPTRRPGCPTSCRRSPSSLSTKC